MSKKELNFEEAIAQLEDIVKNIEEGNLSLEQALTAYEKGVTLAAWCTKALETAKLKVEKLQKKGSEIKLENFDEIEK